VEVFAALQEGGPVVLGSLHQRALKETGIQRALKNTIDTQTCPANYRKLSGIRFPFYLLRHPNDILFPSTREIFLSMRSTDSCILTYSQLNPFSAPLATLSLGKLPIQFIIERLRVRVLAGAACEFSSPGSTFCADLFWYRFHPRVPSVARKRSQPFYP